MRDFCDYTAYIFDLYGTLIDIHTDETPPALWRFLADQYAARGAEWTPAALRRHYLQFCRQEEALLIEQTGVQWPEIKLEKVFLRLLTEAKRLPSAPEDADDAAWVEATAHAFRAFSREYLMLFPGAIELLDGLCARGKRVFLLSNAQAVFTRPELQQCGLSDRFEDIFISSDFGMKKPEPAFLAALIEQHGLAAEDAVMIGNDWRDDMGVAAANGVDGVWINANHLSAAERRERRMALERRFPAARVTEVQDLQALAKLL